MTSSEDGSSKLKLNKTKTTEEIILGFQKLRNEHRYLCNKFNELDLDLQEHRIVVNTLIHLEGDRKCFRMVGGILCERTVKEVIPILKANEENLEKVMESCSQQLTAKEGEINKYKQEHNLKFKATDDVTQSSVSENKSQNSDTNETATGPLVGSVQ